MTTTFEFSASKVAGHGADYGPWHGRMAARAAVENHAEWSEWEPDTAVQWIAGAADRHRDEAADIGTRVHKWCADYAVGDQREPDLTIAGHARQFITFCRAFGRPEFTHVERAVFSRHGYAGTFDFIATIPGHGRLLCDIKTGRSIHPEAVALQLAAYRYADWMPDPAEVYMTPDHTYTWGYSGTLDDAAATAKPVPEVDGCAVLHLRPRSHHLVPITAGVEQHRTFLYALEHLRHTANARDLLGPELHPAEEAAA